MYVRRAFWTKIDNHPRSLWSCRFVFHSTSQYFYVYFDDALYVRDLPCSAVDFLRHKLVPVTRSSLVPGPAHFSDAFWCSKIEPIGRELFSVGYCQIK